MTSNPLARCVVAALAALALAGCNDGDDAPARRNDALMTAPPSITAVRSNAPEQVKMRNQFALVGRAHNRAMEDFRAELRKPGVLTSNICEHVLEFAARDERLPEDHRIARALRRDLAASGARNSPLCSRSLLASGYAPASYRVRREEPSAQLLTLSSQLESAIEYSTDRYDLAGRLNAILDQASALSEDENAVISAAVAVAQESYDYWEVNLSGFTQEFESEYGQCATDRKAEGYTYEDARGSCIGGSTTYQTFWKWPTAPDAINGLVSRFRRTCGPGLKDGFREVVRADARGAFSGAVSGLKAGLSGVIGGAILGGTSASTWAAAENAWTTFWCIMEK